MYTQDLESQVCTMIQQLEVLANQPPRLCWGQETQSGLEVLGSQSSDQALGAVTLPENQAERDVSVTCDADVGH